MKTLRYLFLCLFVTGTLAFTPANGQCPNPPNPNRIRAAAWQNSVIRDFVLPYRSSSFWVEDSNVTINSDNTYTVAWTFTPSCYTETPPCLMPSQIVCALLDCELNVIAICVS